MSLRILEWVRSPDQIWNLPGRHVESLRARLPGVELDSPRDREEAERLLPAAEVVLGWLVTPQNFARATALRWIHSTAAGVRPLLFPELVASDVMVSNSRGLHAVPMAEHALGLMLAFARKLHRSRDAQRERRWVQREQWEEAAPFRTLAGSTMVLVGLGAVGTAIAERARALGVKVVAVRRRPEAGAGAADEVVGAERLREALARGDWVVIAAPETPATERLIGAAELLRMKRSAVLINLGRGALVDEAALVAALERGALAGAALDVMEVEPLPATSPLWTLDNVIVTPHISGVSADLWERAMDLFVAHVAAYRAGRPLPNLVDKRAGY